MEVYKQLQIDIPEEILISLNESESKFKQDMKIYTAIWLYIKEKLTIGKATQLSGINRYEFEKLLSENEIPVSLLTYDDIHEDYNKLKNIVD